MYKIVVKKYDKGPAEYRMDFYMVTEGSTAVYYGPYIDDISEYHKIVDEGFTKKIQTIKGFTRFCGWLESGRPKTFKLKELEYVAQHLNQSERFLKWSNDPNLKNITDIVQTTDKQIVILKNASKEQVQVQCRDGKDKVYLKPQQIVILVEGEVGRIIN